MRFSPIGVCILVLSFCVGLWLFSRPAFALDFGETTQLSVPDSGNGSLLLAQQATLTQAGTLQSLSFFVTSTGGDLRLGLYAANGPGGNPGTKLAETAAFTPVAGWNTHVTTTTPELAVGTYWLAYWPQSNSLGFVKTEGGLIAWYPLTYSSGSLPATFGTSVTTEAVHWSFYGTVTVSGSPPPQVTGVTMQWTFLPGLPITFAWDYPPLAGQTVSLTGGNFELIRDGILLAAVVSYVDDQLTFTGQDTSVSSGQHCWAVRAVLGAEISLFSNEVCAYVP